MRWGKGYFLIFLALAALLLESLCEKEDEKADDADSNTPQEEEHKTKDKGVAKANGNVASSKKGKKASKGTKVPGKTTPSKTPSKKKPAKPPSKPPAKKPPTKSPTKKLPTKKPPEKSKRQPAKPSAKKKQSKEAVEKKKQQSAETPTTKRPTGTGRTLKKAAKTSTKKHNLKLKHPSAGKNPTPRKKQKGRGFSATKMNKDSSHIESTQVESVTNGHKIVEKKNKKNNMQSQLGKEVGSGHQVDEDSAVSEHGSLDNVKGDDSSERGSRDNANDDSGHDTRPSRHKMSKERPAEDEGRGGSEEVVPLSQWNRIKSVKEANANTLDGIEEQVVEDDRQGKGKVNNREEEASISDNEDFPRGIHKPGSDRGIQGRSISGGRGWGGAGVARPSGGWRGGGGFNLGETTGNVESKSSGWGSGKKGGGWGGGSGGWNREGGKGRGFGKRKDPVSSPIDSPSDLIVVIIKDTLAGNCLASVKASTELKVRVQLDTCEPYMGQEWVVKSVEEEDLGNEGEVILKNGNSKFCLQVRDESMMIQAKCKPSHKIYWKFEPSGVASGFHFIESMDFPGQCIDNRAGISPCNQTEEQKFNIIRQFIDLRDFMGDEDEELEHQ